MKIVVCVKQVPDSAARVVVEDGRISWGDAPLVINPWDEYAVEAALKQKEAYGGSVTVLSMGKEDEKEAIKHALAMGCDDAILVSDPALAGADGAAAARVLAAAIAQDRGGRPGVLWQAGHRQRYGHRPGNDGPCAGLAGSHPGLHHRPGWGWDVSASSVATEEGRQVVSGTTAGGAERHQGLRRTALPLLYGYPQSGPRPGARMGVWATWASTAPAAVVSWPEVMNPPVREITNEIITGDSPQEIAEKSGRQDYGGEGAMSDKIWVYIDQFKGRSPACLLGGHRRRPGAGGRAGRWGDRPGMRLGRGRRGQPGRSIRGRPRCCWWMTLPWRNSAPNPTPPPLSN